MTVVVTAVFQPKDGKQKELAEAMRRISEESSVSSLFN